MITGFPDENGMLSEHFSADEFRCKCCGQIIRISTSLLEDLEELRSVMGEALYVNSGYRCEKHNLEIGGVSNSQHCKGTAVDIYTEHTTPHELSICARRIFDSVGKYSSFVHVDNRDDGYSQGEYYWEGDY